MFPRASATEAQAATLFQSLPSPEPVAEGPTQTLAAVAVEQEKRTSASAASRG